MEYKIKLTKEESEKYLRKGKGIKLKIYNENNEAISLKTIFYAKPFKGKKRCLTCDNRESMKKTKSEDRVEKFINELMTPINVEDLLIPEIQNVENYDVEKLVERYISLGNTNSKNILIWYNIGQTFEQEIKARINRTKTDQTVREELYDEMMKFIVDGLENIDEKQKKRDTLRKRMQGAIKIYKLFIEIGPDKIYRVKETFVTTIIKLTNPEVQQIIRRIEYDWES
ncbi:unnamed protein product [Rhizophagus irregularis]|uniref:Uncharacterized protein n=1 Tax=Rhizophagus irregularis TaxID=588596 RepID=A0A2I1G4D7_9GLOM|nr:hypothetical protein RhiirA4_416709 [Rhizophagus irregularis]CAB4441800.1 unnamed protein product [Rhizophagus irregularis]